MTDKTTRITLIAIAIGLWVNAFGHFLMPRTAHAQDYSDGAIQQMADDIHAMAEGTCVNDTLCK